MSRVIDNVSLKSANRAPFVFAERMGRAAEVSLSANGWWIEFWEDDDDEDAPPIKEITVANADEAVREVTAWLLPHAGKDTAA